MSLNITQLGKYEIRRELGKGAMGVVYEGFDPVLLRRVAIKTILPAQLVKGEAADVMARFRREAQAAGRLNHPGVVAVYDYGEAIASDDQTRIVPPGSDSAAGHLVAFIAMEFVEGRELKEHFEANECFTVTESARIMGEILDALAHSHSQGVIHRDIKPANLIMLADGRIKIADFGIARTDTSELTLAGTVMGTPAYMSPEQFLGQRVDARSDLFSCGIVLYQFLTGEKPFTGNPTTIMYKVLREEAIPPCHLNLMLPPVWNEVLKTAIAKHPDDRYQSASDFAAAIRLALARHGPGPLVADTQMGLHPSQTAALDAATKAEVPRSREPPITAQTGLRSHRALRLGVAALALLIVAATVLYAAIGNRQSAPSLGVAAPMANPASPEVIPTPPTPVPVSVVPQPEPEPAPQAVTALPQPAPATLQAPASVAAEPAANATPAVVKVPKPAKAQNPIPKLTQPAADARSPRCALILQKAMLDEPLKPEERKFLNESCQ